MEIILGRINRRNNGERRDYCQTERRSGYPGQTADAGRKREGNRNRDHRTKLGARKFVWIRNHRFRNHYPNRSKSGDPGCETDEVSESGAVPHERLLMRSQRPKRSSLPGPQVSSKMSQWLLPTELHQ